MSKPIKKKTVCALCNKELNLSTQILLEGCPYCGSFKFKTFRELSNVEEKEQELDLIVEKEIEESDIEEGVEAIRLTSEGVFEVDIGKLLTDSDEDQPIISRDKDGSYYIKIQQKKQQEEE
ncbi:MAG: OapC/ArvC family zinc-ribbon domain-containing protein [Candidatus Heimdallarchaeaceae archaeon]